MQVILSSRHMDVDPETREYFESKLRKLTRFYNRITSIETVLDKQGEAHIVEAIVHADHGLQFVASESGPDVYSALDLVLDKLERQLARHKERFRNRKHQTKRPDKSPEA